MKHLLFATLIAAVILVAASCAGDDVFDGSWTNKNQAKTPKGATVYGPEPATPEKLRAIDAGLDRAFDIASRVYNYKGFQRHQDYTITLLKASDRCQDPGFIQRADGSPYDGTPWDKDPAPGKVLICAAGETVRYGADETSPGAPGMLLVDDLGTLELVTRYEAEHNILLEVDRPKYAATQYHITGGHPILPDLTERARPRISEVVQ